jgi:WhiB family redox-sensing transcriptional regulator
VSESGKPVWMFDAACSGADVEVFFPGPGRGKAGGARAICAECPVTVECLEYALTLPDWNGFPLAGVWGGTTARERAVMRKPRPRSEPAHGTATRYYSSLWKCRCSPCRAAAAEYVRRRRAAIKAAS